MESLWDLREKLFTLGFKIPIRDREESKSHLRIAPTPQSYSSTYATNHRYHRAPPPPTLPLAIVTGRNGERRYLGGVLISDTTQIQYADVRLSRSSSNSNNYTPNYYTSVRQVPGAKSSRPSFLRPPKAVQETGGDAEEEAEEVEMDQGSENDSDCQSSVGSEDHQLCVVCADRKVGTTFFPCRHLCVCRLCFIRLPMKWGEHYERNELFKSCPLCRANIVSIEY